MKIKQCTDADCSIMQQHLFVFVDLFFFWKIISAAVLPNQCKQTAIDGAELCVTVMSSFLFIYAALQEKSHQAPLSHF